SHAGNLWATDIGDTFGTGLGLSGAGEGGGGNGEGIGMNGISGLGLNGTCSGVGCTGGPNGIGHGSGLVRGTHVAKGPQVRQPKDIETNGHLPAEVFQRIVRMNAGRYRNCYE